MRAILSATILVCMSGAAAAAGAPPAAMEPAAAARFAGLALKCLHTEYPNHISHTLDGDADARPPHLLNPAFYGCFDWHSDVHGHWLLVRLLRLDPGAPFAATARAELARSLTAQNIAGEVAYLQRPDRASFERPYGLAWLLKLTAELRSWNDPQAKQWAGVLGYDAEKPRSVRKDSPQRGYTTSVYGPMLEGIWAEGVGHNVQVVAGRDMAFFGIK